MGIEWLREIVQILTDAGIRAGEEFPAGRQPELTGPVAAVGLRDLNCREGIAEFEIRILSPRTLGGWQCQSASAKAVTVLETAGVECRMEPMAYRSKGDCFEVVILGRKLVSEQEVIQETSLFRITVQGEAVEMVTDFSAVQDRGRRMIGALNQVDPVGITRGVGGWKIRMVQTVPEGGMGLTEPEEPFELRVHEKDMVTVFSGCSWNSVTKILNQKQSRVEWEGFALTRTEALNE